MSSSDSGEDFESADEGFDIEEKSSSKKNQSKNNKVSDKVTEIKQAGSPDKVTEIVNQRISNITLENLPDPKNVDSENQGIKISLLNLDISDKSQLKPTKKLGTKLICTKNVQTKESPLVCLKRGNEDVLEKEENNDVLNINTSHKISNNLSKTPENVKRTSKPEHYLEESDSKLEDSTFSKSKSSDGWDFEEEDGFTVPSGLSRTSHSSTSQSANEELQEKGWGGWGGWGVSSLLNTATDSVSTFSSQVTAGLSTVLETTVGAPDPETLAASTELLETKQVKEMSQSEDDKSTGSYGGLGSLVSGVTMLGTSVINRGLDTLESLGKKTMEVLQEGDPGLKKKRAILFADQDKPVLSQILREAKEKAERSDKEKEEKESARRAHFESLFDDFQGMVHLEALEMLSTQCELKLQSLLLGESGTALDDLQETLSQVQDLCEVPDDEDESEVLTPEQFNEQVTKCIDGLRIKSSAIKITQVNDAVVATLNRLGGESEKAMVVHQMAISSLAEFSAAAMECFHKSAELVMAKTLHNTADEAESYVKLTGLLCARVSSIANDFTQMLTKNHPIANSSLITNIFLEASNSSSYMKNACQLLVPILQVGAVCS